MVKKKLFVLSVLASMLLIAPSQALAASDTKCEGALAFGTFDNVVVPPGATCILTDSVVKGNVKALENSRLVSERNRVKGNIQGDKADLVHIIDNKIGGNVEIVEFGAVQEDPSEAEPSAIVIGSTLPNGSIHILKGDQGGNGDFLVSLNDVRKGNIKVEENNTQFLSVIAENKVAGNLQVFKNTGTAFKLVILNVVGENLQCKENDEPFVGQPNEFGGNAEDQCAGSG